LLIVYWVFLGAHRFSDLQSQSGLSRSLLTNRLRRLELLGVLERCSYESQRSDYRLTKMGKDLYSVALALIEWDKSWHYDAECITHHIVHTGCGQGFTPQARCGHCHDLLVARDCDWQRGSGEPGELLSEDNRQRRSRVSPGVLSQAHPIMDRSLEILGDRWTALIIAAAFFRVRSFKNFQQTLGIATNILSDRLSRLTELGVLIRAGDGHPEYRLSQSGLALFPVIVALLDWGDRWLCSEEKPALILTHLCCGQALAMEVCCDQCNAVIKFGEFRSS
jgi:DNA-binding HxlR family transcriptional regulator